MLNEEEKLQLKERIPKDIELSFGKRLQRKVQSDLYIIIPKGKKCALWFTYYKTGNACIMVDIDNSRTASNFNLKNVCFNNELAYGTVLVGTIFKYKGENNNKLEFFTVEHIKYYKGENVSNLCFEKQLNICQRMFEKDLKNINELPNFLNIVMPVVKTSYNEAVKTLEEVYYPIYGIKFWNLNEINSIGDLSKDLCIRLQEEKLNLSIYNNVNYEQKVITSIKPTEKVKSEPYNSSHNSKNIFNIKSNIGFDSYSIYGLNSNKQEEYFGKLNIPDYKTSVMMNRIFRKIKENENLDLLEESDDEEEFQDTNETKYVDLDKVVPMYCVFLPKFKAWKPISIANQNDKISNIPTPKYVENKRLNNININVSEKNKMKPYSSYKIKFNSFKKLNKKLQDIVK